LVDGMMALSTSGNDNKNHMRQNEIHIAYVLSKLMSSTVTPPEPLNSGFTTEDAEVLLAQEFKYVYKFEHKAKIVIKTAEQKEIMLDAYRTLRDKYTDARGRKPDVATFEAALYSVVTKEFDRAARADTYVEDQLTQAAFFASDTPKNLPKKFVLISSPLNQAN